MDEPYPLDERLDPDIWPLRRWPDRLARALAWDCRCGHARADHAAATGALGSFGGSACDRCWGCGTFEPTFRSRWRKLTRVRPKR